MAIEKILVIDDELAIRKSLQEQLINNNYSVATADTIASADHSLANDVFDLVFMDVRLPDGDGTDLLRTFSKKENAPLIVMMTGYASVESAVNCMRAGAFDYIIKPFYSSQIDIIVKKAEEYSHILSLNRFYNQIDDQDTEILGSSRAINSLRRLIHKVAPTGATVLIQGESGTGKELVANEIHKASDRVEKPFIKVNCASISDTLIESEFFGHEKGAFTGAMERREGRFELADGGTILLDEVSEISPALQAKLLRVLQEREFERVGGNTTIKVDVRVLATTNRNLAQCVERSEFRQDLFYRLNVFPITNPTLRERKSDINQLSRHFAMRAARKHGVKIDEISPDALEFLQAQDWPGNVRELQNTVERAVIMSENIGTLDAVSFGQNKTANNMNKSSLSIDNAQSTGMVSAPRSDDVISLEQMEKIQIMRALHATDGNRTHAADLLKITVRTLRNKLKQYRLDGEIIPEPQASGKRPSENER